MNFKDCLLGVLFLFVCFPSVMSVYRCMQVYLLLESLIKNSSTEITINIDCSISYLSNNVYPYINFVKVEKHNLPNIYCRCTTTRETVTSSGTYVHFIYEHAVHRLVSCALLN